MQKLGGFPVNSKRTLFTAVDPVRLLGDARGNTIKVLLYYPLGDAAQRRTRKSVAGRRQVVIRAVYTFALRFCVVALGAGDFVMHAAGATVQR